MALYAIGDIHGCYDEFVALLKKIHFKPNSDQLYLVGDLINRGPKSRAVLDYVLDQDTSIHAILGNHEFAFLVFSERLIRLKKWDTYDELLNNSHTDYYINYIKNMPLALHLPEYNTLICHAGLAHNWTIPEALLHSQEVSNALTNSKNYLAFLQALFGNTPNYWDSALTGDDRIRSIVNHFTRMRFIDDQGALDFDYKGSIKKAPKPLKPWFTTPHSYYKETRIIFGHWAALGLHQENNTICIDSGCCWGEALTAVRLDTPEPIFFQVPSQQI